MVAESWNHNGTEHGGEVQAMGSYADIISCTASLKNSAFSIPNSLKKFAVKPHVCAN